MYLDRANDGPADFINGFLKSNDCLLQNGNLLCFNARTIAEWLKRGYDGPFASSKFANSWRVYASYRARDLPTRIGKVEGDFLVSDKNQAGFLSYGPYISLPAGLYKVKIRYKSSSLSKPITGRWDIMSSSASGHSYHGEGELANTQDNVTEFQTLVEVEDFNKQDVFEVRLYVYQDVRFTLESLEILEYRDVVAPRIR